MPNWKKYSKTHAYSVECCECHVLTEYTQTTKTISGEFLCNSCGVKHLEKAYQKHWRVRNLFRTDPAGYGDYIERGRYVSR